MTYNISQNFRGKAWCQVQWIVLRSKSVNCPHFTAIVHHSTLKKLTDYNSQNFVRRFLVSYIVHCFTISDSEPATFYDHCTSFNTAVYDRCISPTLNCSALECVTKPFSSLAKEKSFSSLAKIKVFSHGLHLDIDVVLKLCCRKWSHTPFYL